MRAGSGVELLRLRQRQARRVDAFVEDLLNQHPELGAPVANVVLRNHAVANASDNPTQAVSNHGRAQIPDMHLFRDVGRGVVDHRNLRVRDLCDAQVRVGELVGHRLGQHLSSQPEVDEAGPRDLGRLAEVGNLQPGRDVRSNLTR